MPHASTPSNQPSIDEAQVRLLAEGLRHDTRKGPPLLSVEVAASLHRAGAYCSHLTLADTAIATVSRHLCAASAEVVPMDERLRAVIPAQPKCPSLMTCPWLSDGPALFAAIQRLRAMKEAHESCGALDADLAALALVIRTLDPQGLTLDETGGDPREDFIAHRLAKNDVTADECAADPSASRLGG